MPFKAELATDLGGFADVLAELGAIPSRAAAAIADDFDTFVDQCFATQTDPYGNAWDGLMPSTIERKGFATVLEETGALRAETGAFPTRGAGIEFRTRDIGFFHQGGTVNMVARKYLPDSSDGLPIEWEEAIERRLSEAFGKVGRRA